MHGLALALALHAHAEAPPAAPNVVVGDTALVFALPALNSDVAEKLYERTTISLGEFTGLRPSVTSKVIAVSFVRRSDGDSSLKELARIHRKYAKRGVAVLAVVSGGDGVSDASSWIQPMGLPFPALFDAHDVVTSRYGVRSFPMTVVIDGYDAPTGNKGKSKERKTWDESGDILAIGAGTQGLSADLDVILDGMTETP